MDVSDQIDGSRASTLIPRNQFGSGPGAEVEIRESCVVCPTAVAGERQAGLEHTWIQFRCLVRFGTSKSLLLCSWNPAPRLPCFGLGWPPAGRNSHP